MCVYVCESVRMCVYVCVLCEVVCACPPLIIVSNEGDKGGGGMKMVPTSFRSVSVIS